MRFASKIVTSIVMAVAMVVGGLVATVAPASAAEPQSGSEITTSTSTASVTTSEKAEAVNGVSISSKVTVLAYVQAKGATKAQMLGKKYRLTKAKKLLTSYKNVAGQEAWWVKSYPKGKVFVLGKDGWYHDPVCWNKVPTPRKKPHGPIVRGAVKIVKSFTFTASSTATAKGDAVAKAKAWCVTDWNSAEATGTGTANFFATATASGSGRTWIAAKAAAKGAANGKINLQITSRFALEMWLKVTAEGKATADATAKVTCSGGPPPPPVPGPIFLQFREFNDLEVNWTSDHCVTVDFPAGHSGTVYWTATYGSFATPSKPAQDGVQVCSNYRAPSEVPAGGTDTITVTATDATTDKSVTKSTAPFVIHTTAQPPL